jgi:hypothetical protein
LLREYGLEGPGVRGFCSGGARGGAGLANRGGAPIALFENPEGVSPPFLAGVAVKLGCGLRRGDSGRDSDGRPFGLNDGLGARAPGPTDCENLDVDGVSGLKCGFVVVERLKLFRYDDGVVGVGGKSSEVADDRFCARCTGRKMPDPGVVVRKYCLLPAVSMRAKRRNSRSPHPSTSPSFFPRDAYSLLSSTPANTPFLLDTAPMNFTVPCMPPGTSTRSPSPMSTPFAPILLTGGELLPTRAFREALRWKAVLAESDRLGDDSAGCRYQGQRASRCQCCVVSYLQRRPAKTSRCLEGHSDRLATAALW